MTKSILEILRDQVDQGLDSDAVRIVPDRQIPSLFAVRIDDELDYIVNQQTKSVEKVRFDRWPPE